MKIEFTLKQIFWNNFLGHHVMIHDAIYHMPPFFIKSDLTTQLTPLHSHFFAEFNILTGRSPSYPYIFVAWIA